MDPIVLVVVILVLLWAMGAFIWPVGGSVIHLLLVIAIVVLLFRLLSGRRLL